MNYMMTWWQWCLLAWGVCVVVSWWQLFSPGLPKHEDSGRIDWRCFLAVAGMIAFVAPYSIWMIEQAKRRRQQWRKVAEMNREPDETIQAKESGGQK